MATILKLGTGGQQDLQTVADKFNTTNDLFALRDRIGGSGTVVFPVDFYEKEYLRFGDPSLPFTSNSNLSFVATNITCYGVPVFSSNVAWITWDDSPFPETNGVLITNARVVKNVSTSERIGTVVVTVTQPIGTYVISTTLVQEGLPPTYEAISLGFDVSEGNTAACSDFVFAPSTYYINPEANGVFADATSIKKLADGAGFATGGWYSDGSVARFWSGVSFTSQELCTI